MTCPNCGTSNLDTASICANCGRPLSAPPPPPPPPPPQQAQSTYTPPSSSQRPPGFGAPPPPVETIPNYLVQSILVTLCCCLPFGIVAIIFAAQVNSKLAAGDVAGAREASANARKWCWIALIVGIVLQLVWLGFYGLAMLQALRESGSI